MYNAKSYIEGRELLFRTILIVCLIGTVLNILQCIILDNHSQILVNCITLAMFGSIWVIFYRFSKNLAYHAIIWGLLMILAYGVIVDGVTYYAVLLLPPSAIIYNFVFFESKKVLWGYFVAYLILQFLFLSITMEISLPTKNPQFYLEYTNAIAYLISLFFIGNFFINNIKKQEKQLTIAGDNIKQKKLELVEKNDVLDKYIESNVQLESFAHLAAHELKAPIRSISSFISLLKGKMKDRLDPKEEELFGIITTSSRNMFNMVGALNQLGSVSKMQLNPSTLDVKKIFEEILFDRKEDIEIKHAEIDIEQETDIIKGDYTLIKQLLSNLIGNAIKFVPEGTKPQIKVAVKTSSDFYNIILDDNGIGIPENERSKIFELFHRLNGPTKFSGSGIGLAISKKIVELHNGKIWVEDSKLGGSRFCVNLPKAS